MISDLKLFIDHIVLTISDIERTKDFYTRIFGEPKYSDSDSVMYMVGETKLFLGLPYGSLIIGDRFNPNRIGLEHLAFGVSSIQDLIQIENHLNKKTILDIPSRCTNC